MQRSYQLRDPRRKLHDITGEWLAKVTLHGQQPNREVMFGDEGVATEQTRAARGFLLVDGRSGSDYLVMEDGDVLCLHDAAWMTGPTDGLVSALGRAVTDAMYRRQGLFAAGSAVTWVPERRACHAPFAGPEKRAYLAYWIQGGERPPAAHPGVAAGV